MWRCQVVLCVFFFNDTATTEIYTLSLHDALPISIRLVYPESRVRISREKHNVLPDKPTSISFPFAATVKTKKGAEHWRYAEHKFLSTNGQPVFTPPNLVLRSVRVLQETDIELVYWLLYCCPGLEGGENFNGRMPKCTIEDLVGIAERKVRKEAKLADVKALIYSDRVGLGEKKLRLVAKAYFIRGVDELSYAQVKLAVEFEIKRNKTEGVQKFLDLVDAEQTLSVKSTIQSAIDDQIITFMVKNRTWAWVTENGKKNEAIATIGASADPNEALYSLYMGDVHFAEQLQAAVKGELVIPV